MERHTYKAYVTPNDKHCIQHYGIKGQKWGVRNYEGYDGLLTPEGKERYYGSKRKLQYVNDPYAKDTGKKSIRSNITSKVFKASRFAAAATMPISMATESIIPVAVATSTAFVAPAIAYTTITAAYKLQEKKAKARAEKFETERMSKPIDKETGLHLETENLTDEESIKRVNPLYHNWNSNTKSNCTLCTIAMELRKRGYDVEANKISKGMEWPTIMDNLFKLDKKYSSASKYLNALQDFQDAKKDNKSPEVIKKLDDKCVGYYDEFLKSAYNEVAAKRRFERGYKYTITKEESRDEIKAFKKMVTSDGPSRGEVGIQWNGFTSGHSMFYEVDKTGNVKVMDAQCGKIYSYEQFYKKFGGKVRDISAIRLDNAKINNKEIKNAVS